MSDALATVGVPKFSVNVGYFYSTFNPYTLFDQPPPPPVGNAFYTPRSEITVGASTTWGRYRISGWARRNIRLNEMVSVGGDASYEDECFILDLRVFRRYTTYNGDNGATTALIQMTLKTVGQFGYRAL